MTTHELAKLLLSGPDLPAIIYEYDNEPNQAFTFQPWINIKQGEEPDEKTAVLYTCRY